MRVFEISFMRGMNIGAACGVLLPGERFCGKFYKLRKNNSLSDKFGSGCFWFYFAILFVFIQLCSPLHVIINTNNLFKITRKIITD